MVMDTHSHTEPKTHHRLSHTAHRTRESKGDCGWLRERLHLLNWEMIMAGAQTGFKHKNRVNDLDLRSLYIIPTLFNYHYRYSFYGIVSLLPVTAKLPFSTRVHDTSARGLARESNAESAPHHDAKFATCSESYIFIWHRNGMPVTSKRMMRLRIKHFITRNTKRNLLKSIVQDNIYLKKVSTFLSVNL